MVSAITSNCTAWIRCQQLILGPVHIVRPREHREMIVAVRKIKKVEKPLHAAGRSKKIFGQLDEMRPRRRQSV